MVIQAGALRHKVTLYSVTESVDADFGPTETETAIGTAWASITPTSGGENWGAEQVNSTRQVEIKMRWSAASSLTPKHRIGKGTRRFDIVAVQNVEERSREAVILAHERVT